MTFTATVENDIIKLPSGVHLPNGTKVTVEPQEKPSRSGRQAKSSVFASVLKHAGTVETLPEDFAERHDEYIRGHKPR